MTQEARQRLEPVVKGSVDGLTAALSKCEGALDKTDAAGWTPREVIAHATFAGGAGLEPFLRPAIAAGQLEIQAGALPDASVYTGKEAAELKAMVETWGGAVLSFVESLSDEELTAVVKTSFGDFPAEQLIGLLAGFHAQDHAAQLNAMGAP